MASAFLAMPRGSRLYGSPVVGSSTSQVMTMVVSAKNGSIVAVTGSGIRHMSDSLIAFHPAIEDPSNIVPSENISSLSLIDFRTSLAVFMNTPFGLQVVWIAGGLDYRLSGSGRGQRPSGSA